MTEIRTPKQGRLSVAGSALLLGGVFVLIVLLHNWVYIFNAPSKLDLTDGQRRSVMLSALARGPIPVVRQDGAVVRLARADIAEVGRSRCVAEHECTQRQSSRRRGRRSVCKEVQTKLSCAYEVVTTDGRPAATLLLTGRGRLWPTIADARDGSPSWVSETASFQVPPEGEIKSRLCALDYCDPAGFARWAAVAKPAPVDPDVEARARCKGVLTTVVGRGQVCIDPADPAAREFRDCKDGFCGPRMVAVPPGRYMRGVPAAELAALKTDFPAFTSVGRDEHPARDVAIAYTFAAGVTEITFDEWDACLADHGCRGMTRAEDVGWGRGTRPVVNITWAEVARVYIPWLNAKLGLRGEQAYRLLSDGEWEYAARAGTTTRTAFGDRLTREQANFHHLHFSAPRGRTMPVASFPPNGFGLHDMHGNVAEWVEDCLTFTGSASSDLPVDGRARTQTVFGETCAANESRVVRGGSYAQTAEAVRSAQRDVINSETRSSQIGVRLARTLGGVRPAGPPTPAKVGPVFR